MAGKLLVLAAGAAAFLSGVTLTQTRSDIWPGTVETGPYVEAGKDISDVAFEISMEDYETAAALADSLLVRDSLSSALHYYLGVCKLRTGDISGAVTELGIATSIDPDTADYYESLLLAYNMLGTEEGRDSADSLTVVLADRFPKKYRTPYTLTMMGDRQLYKAWNDSLAIRYYDEALAMEEDYVPALLGRAEAYRAQGNDVIFFSSIERFAGMDYVNPEVKCEYIEHILQGINAPTYRVFGKQIDGIVDICANTHPADSSALVFAGRWFYSTGRKEKGTEYFRQWRDAAPDNFNAEMLYISLLINDGTDKEVVAACDEALKRFEKADERSRLFNTKADHLYKMGKKKASYKAYEAALKEEPDNAMTLNNYAYFLSLDRKHLRKAEKMSRQAVDAEPENVNYLDTYGYILYLLKRPVEAKAYFKKAIIYGGKDVAAVLLHYSQVLDALGEKELASYYFGLFEAKENAE